MKITTAKEHFDEYGFVKLPGTLPYELGEVSYHLGWTFHRASPNTTGIPRRVMTVIYMDADITVSEPVNDNQRADLDAWLGATPVGNVPDSPLNPVLYRA